jgi:hypothetical protein
LPQIDTFGQVLGQGLRQMLDEQTELVSLDGNGAMFPREISMKHFAISMAMLVLSCLAYGEIWTVDDDGPADFDNIQDAIDSAVSGDEVVVAPGIYTGSGWQVVFIPNIAFTLRATGLAGETIIDGEGARRGIAINSGAASGTVIEGFVIRNGLAGDYGGGVYCWGSSPTIRSCTISGNYAPLHGGGIFCQESSPTVLDCEISGNTAGSYGGGMYNAGGGEARVTACTISANSSGGGGGIFNNWGTSPIFVSCAILANASTAGGGGMYNNGSASPQLFNCSFDSNTTATGGGAITNSGGSGPRISGCTITNNSASSAGAMLSFSNNPSLIDTVVCGNGSNQIQGGWTDEGGNSLAQDCLDCNDNGIPDEIDISVGASEDIDNSGTPDECDCLVDVSGDGQVDINDVLSVVATFGSTGPLGDVNFDGVVDINDLLLVMGSWGVCP